MEDELNRNLERSKKRTIIVEALAKEFHTVYQIEARRQGDVRHKDKYEDLPDNIKEFDRVLARYVLDHFDRKKGGMPDNG